MSRVSYAEETIQAKGKKTEPLFADYGSKDKLGEAVVAVELEGARWKVRADVLTGSVPWFRAYLELRASETNGETALPEELAPLPLIETVLVGAGASDSHYHARHEAEDVGDVFLSLLKGRLRRGREEYSKRVTLYAELEEERSRPVAEASAPADGEPRSPPS